MKIATVFFADIFCILFCTGRTLPNCRCVRTPAPPHDGSFPSSHATQVDPLFFYSTVYYAMMRRSNSCLSSWEIRLGLAISFPFDLPRNQFPYLE